MNSNQQIRNGRRSGIILIMVLSMLGLFSLLAVSYIVFTSRARTTAAAIGFKERTNVDTRPLLNLAQQQIIRGTNGPSSSLWGHDLLGDYYGHRDTIANGQIRNANQLVPTDTPMGGGAAAEPNAVYHSGNERQFPENIGQVFSYLDGQFLRVPTNLVANGSWPGWGSGRPSDDLATGRYLTMTEGPLKDITFEIVRSFGDYGNGPQTSGLTGAVMLDLTPHLLRGITLDESGTALTKTLEQWVRDGEVNALLYDSLGAWGAPGVDDNSNSIDDDRSEAGAPGSDDVGFTFVINGERLNGFGLGVSGAGATLEMNAQQTAHTIMTPDGADADTDEDPVAIDGLTDGRSISVALQPNYSAYRSGASGLPMGDMDEPYDSPDTQNFFIGYFPADAELSSPTPSFVRPALVNYILNEYGGSLSGLTAPQLKALIRLLQRSTLRPLPIANDPLATNAGTNEGVRAFRWDSFSGSNPAMSTPIDFSSTNTTQLATQLFNLARALVGEDTNGDGLVDTFFWDVDNDGDGVPDSVWVDAGLPLVTMPSGQVVKPMVAYRIEDLGGRVDINSAGSMAWFANPTNPQPPATTNTTGGIARTPLGGPPPVNPEMLSVEAFRGFGFGPAELSLATMFWAPGYDPSIGSTVIRHYGRQLLRRKYGVEGGELAPGRNIDPLTVSIMPMMAGNDLTGLFRDPSRTQIHQVLGGRSTPFDVFGRGMVVLDVTGQPMISHVSNSFTDSITVPLIANATFDEASNDPYESMLAPSRLPDAAYALDHLEALLRRHDWGAGSLPQELKDFVQAEVSTERAFHNAAPPPKSIPPGFYELASQITVRSSSDSRPVAVPPIDQRNLSNTTFASDLMAPHRFVPVRFFQRLFNPPSVSPIERWTRYASVVPPEIRLGRKFDLNRPLGNGLDDNGNGFIDESSESSVTNTVALVTSGNTFAIQPKPTDFTPEAGPMNSGPPPTPPSKLDLSGNDARQLYARHLYCMLMFMARDDATGTQFGLDAFDTSLSATDRDRLTAWKLAQWAVNAVDFRDPDSVMTGFEFDLNPFDGWDVDGDFTTPTALNDGGVVWGMEAPALLLTENISGHDRRVRDTDQDNGGGDKRLPMGADWGDGDNDMDQYRVPQGFTYFELFCPRSPAPHKNAAAPGFREDRANPFGGSNDLFDIELPDQSLVLDLNRRAPDNNPVWRIAISRAHNDDHPDANAREQSPLNLLTGAAGVGIIRDSFTGQPEQLNYLQARDPAFQFDRVVWLANQDPATVTNLPADTPVHGVYFNRTGANVKLRGGQYAVVGPRTDTVIGSNVYADPLTLPYVDYISDQQLNLTPSTFRITDIAGTLKTPVYDDGATGDAQIRQVVGIIAAANRPSAAWEFDIGVNISEPIPEPGRYYPAPTHILNSTSGGFIIRDAYYDFGAGGPKTLPDEPFDHDPSYAPLAFDFADGERTGTRENYKTAYLQRLADPSQPYHALQNPYLTVDWMPMDLTVYNGEDSNRQEMDASGNSEWIDPFDPAPFGADIEEKFASRYKSGRMVEYADPTALTNRQNNWHSFHTVPPADTNPLTTTPAPGQPYFSVEIHHDTDINAGGDPNLHSTTMGYLNHSFGRRWSQVTGPTPSPQLTPYVGAPDGQKAPWIVWHDRPYASPLELMLVPFSSAGRITMDCATPSMLTELYAAAPPPNLGNAYDGSTARNYRADYQHLLNFFSSDPDFSNSGNFHRLLEWVETPDPFDDAYAMLMPERFPFAVLNSSPPPPWNLGYAGANAWPPTNGTQWNMEMPLELFRAPFNQFPSRVRRGLVNLNTINGNRVYRELMQGVSLSAEIADTPATVSGGKGAFYDDFLISRRGYEIVTGSVISNNYPYRLDIRLDPDFPTQCAGQFVPGAVADLAPLIRPNMARSDWPPNLAADQLRRGPVESGLLRRTPDVRGQFATNGTAKDPARPLPLFARDDTNPLHQDRDRSAFHRYQGITRLANLTTDQSNVFAVWTTIGFFEINTSNFEVGQEYGFEDGSNKRHRSFMIIDRSIPVQYTPGQDNNTSDVIVLQRVLN